MQFFSSVLGWRYMMSYMRLRSSFLAASSFTSSLRRVQTFLLWMYLADRDFRGAVINIFFCTRQGKCIVREACLCEQKPSNVGVIYKEARRQMCSRRASQPSRSSRRIKARSKPSCDFWKLTSSFNHTFVACSESWSIAQIVTLAAFWIHTTPAILLCHWHWREAQSSDEDRSLNTLGVAESFPRLSSAVLRNKSSAVRVKYSRLCLICLTNVGEPMIANEDLWRTWCLPRYSVSLGRTSLPPISPQNCNGHYVVSAWDSAEVCNVV